MAAFENISSLQLQTAGHESLIDIRTTRLPRERPPIDDYDPRQHRTPKPAIKVTMVYFNVLRSLFGAGLLALPLAISQAGFILGSLMSFFTGLLIVHSQLTLLWCLNEISRQLKVPYISYRYGFRIALLHGPLICRVIGRCGPTLIAVFMIMNQIGICTIFVIFTTDSLRDIMDWSSSRPAILTLLLPYLFLEYNMRTLKIVSYISMAGNVMTIISLVMVIYVLMIRNTDEYIFYTIDPFALYFAFGLFLFNMSAIGVILSMDKALVDPTYMTKRFGIIDNSWIVLITLGTFFGCYGYWSAGTMEENILRSLPLDNYVALIAIGLFMVAIIFAYPIQTYPAIQIILDIFKNRNLHTEPSEEAINTMDAICRPVFVLLTFIICYLIPFQGPFVAFVGNLCTTMLVLVFPALMEICIRYPKNYGKYQFYFVKNVIIIAIGVSSWVFGVGVCGYLIYIRILALDSPHEDISFFR